MEKFNIKLSKPTASQVLFYSFYLAAAFAGIAYKIITWNFNKDLNLGVEIIELVVSLIVIVQLLLVMRRYSLFSPLILIFVQALACFTLGELFWILHLYIKNFEPLGSFSISDLSWIGFYAFILTAYRDIFNKQPTKKLQKSPLTILCTVLLLITITAGFTVLFLTGDDLLYTLIYLAPCIMLGYYSVRQLLVNNNYKLLHINILVIIYTDILASMAVNLDLGIASLLKLVFALVILCITPTALLGIQKSQDEENQEESLKEEPEAVEV